MFGIRSDVHYCRSWASGPFRPDDAESWQWTRQIGENLYGFTLVNMPDGELRYVVRRFNGYIGGPRFACAWDHVKLIIIRPEGEAAS
jgi:hypothetical protein